MSVDARNLTQQATPKRLYFLTLASMTGKIHRLDGNCVGNVTCLLFAWHAAWLTKDWLYRQLNIMVIPYARGRQESV
jgi:hypothetical protein